jgi:hypothetical protein
MSHFRCRYLGMTGGAHCILTSEEKLSSKKLLPRVNQHLQFILENFFCILTHRRPCWSGWGTSGSMHKQTPKTSMMSIDNCHAFYGWYHVYSSNDVSPNNVSPKWGNRLFP